MLCLIEILKKLLCTLNIYLDGTGKALIGSSSGDRIQFDGSDFTVQVGSRIIDTSISGQLKKLAFHLGTSE